MQGENGGGDEKEDGKMKDIEKGEAGVEVLGGGNQQLQQQAGEGEFHVARMQRLSATNPLRLVVENATRAASPSPAHSQTHHHNPRPTPSPANSFPRPSPAPSSQPRSTPTSQVGLSMYLSYFVHFRTIDVKFILFVSCLVGYANMMLVLI